MAFVVSFFFLVVVIFSVALLVYLSVTHRPHLDLLGGNDSKIDTPYP